MSPEKGLLEQYGDVGSVKSRAMRAMRPHKPAVLPPEGKPQSTLL